ncbi:sensor domain-containing diguanylate cyclase [Candidatus Bipolaricaulota bacterium]|nr:sensor domain-containing diguanylate cyclase [Candidatus Bipolaricaulota bacterium]
MKHENPSSEQETCVCQETQYRSLFEGVPIGLYITTPEGQFLDANPALCQMLGYPNKQALMMMSVRDLYVDPADREQQCALLEKTIRVHNYEAQLVCADGQSIWVHDTCHAIRDEAGEIVCFEGSLQDITQQRLSEQKLNFMARHDPLTGVFNRYALSEVIEQEASRAQRYQHPIGVLMIDVNRLKEVNDRFGHSTGDRVLKVVADVLSSSVRSSDYVVRFGGDEFLLLLLETNGETPRVRDRILERMAQTQLAESCLDFPITLSIGIAYWKPDQDVSMEAVLSQADDAMYAEKRRQSLLHAELSQ